jgi:3-dehydroquinate synthase
MLKHGLIYDSNYWKKFLDLSKIDFADFDELIYQSIVIKNEIVSQDLTENGIRKSLNFGHTLGHGIESYFIENKDKKTLLHGEAIAVGMILESYISYQKNLISSVEFIEIKTTLNNIFEKIYFDKNDINFIVNLLIHDKKNEYGKVQFALLDGIGKCKINQIVENEIIEMAFDDYKN